jgi:hypothetical protein
MQHRLTLSWTQEIWWAWFVLFCVETGSVYVAQAGLELMILLPQPSECWDYRHGPPYLRVWCISWTSAHCSHFSLISSGPTQGWQCSEASEYSWIPWCLKVLAFWHEWMLLVHFVHVLPPIKALLFLIFFVGGMHAGDGIQARQALCHWT